MLRTKTPRWEVVVGNVGTIYSGPDEGQVRAAFAMFFDASYGQEGKAAGQPVYLFRDAELEEEYHGSHIEEDGEKPIRTWTDPDGRGFTVALWEAHRTSYGKDVLRYRFWHQGELIFEGADLGCSPLHSIDGDEALAGLLSFLALKPGDADPDYFEDYTPRQLAWAERYSEELSGYVERLENPTHYYREPNGDYLVVMPNRVRREEGQKVYDGRAAAVAGLLGSVGSTGVGEDFLAECERVEEEAVPSEWLRALGR